MIESPQKRFQQNKAKVSYHLGIITQPEFQALVDAVLLNYARKLAKAVSPAESWNVGCKLEGAKEALDMLMEFSDAPKPVKQQSSPTMEPV